MVLSCSAMHCIECEQGLDDCHGVLVVHDDGRAECLDVDCTDSDEARHQWRLACGQAFPDRDCCQERVVPERRVA
jgi:hypothetical protein